jgi:hypothetical protein
MKRLSLFFSVLTIGWLTMGATSCPPPGTLPSDLPRATATTPATATAPPVTTATSAPTATPVFCAFVNPDQQTCTCSTQPQGQSFIGLVRNAMAEYQSKHADQFDGHFYKWNDDMTGPSQDVFMAGVGAILKRSGVDYCIDERGGELDVSLHAWKPGDPGSFNESYEIVSSWDVMAIPPHGRLVQDAPLRCKCSPRGF